MQYLPTDILGKDLKDISFKSDDKKLDSWGLFDVVSSHRRELIEKFENLAEDVANGKEVKAEKVLNIFHSIVETEKVILASRSYHKNDYKGAKIKFEESEG